MSASAKPLDIAILASWACNANATVVIHLVGVGGLLYIAVDLSTGV
jgi:hypothetical protein